MLKSIWGEIPATPEARDWVRDLMGQTIWTVKEVQGIYGLSQPTVSRLYTKHDWAFAFKKGSQILFLAEYAKPWFDEYQKGQNDNRSQEKAKQEDKPKREAGRPVKDKNSYTYTLAGVEYKTSEPPQEVHAKWRSYIASQYPDYYAGGKFENVIGHLINDQPEELKAALREVNAVFRKIISDRL